LHCTIKSRAMIVRRTKSALSLAFAARGKLIIRDTKQHDEPLLTGDPNGVVHDGPAQGLIFTMRPNCPMHGQTEVIFPRA
jgi:hypothetical protein